MTKTRQMALILLLNEIDAMGIFPAFFGDVPRSDYQSGHNDALIELTRRLALLDESKQPIPGAFPTDALFEPDTSIEKNNV